LLFLASACWIFFGNSFEINNVKPLKSLRTDLSIVERKEANATCKEVFDNFKKKQKLKNENPHNN
jgi:hypothetical protein